MIIITRRRLFLAARYAARLRSRFQVSSAATAMIMMIFRSTALGVVSQFDRSSAGRLHRRGPTGGWFRLLKLPLQIQYAARKSMSSTGTRSEFG